MALALLALGALGFALARLHTATRVGTGYAAQVICSLALESHLDPAWLERRYVRGEVAPLGRGLSVRVDHGADAVDATGFGLVRARAIHREGLGCTLVADASEPALRGERGPARPRPVLDPALPWPEGRAAAPPPSPSLGRALDQAFREPHGEDAAMRRQTLAVVVAHRGRLVAERYAPGIDPTTPLMSWSMAKSVLATLVGIAAREGRLDLEAAAPVPEWSNAADPRHRITPDQLLRMSSGLAFDETYGALNDVSVMLFTRGDTGAFAAAMPLAHPPDTVWSYSSGTSNLLARLLRDALGGTLAQRVGWARERLFDPAAMTTAVFEPDASGSFIGSSFVLASARDWARFGELHRRDGMWQGRRILPPGWVERVTTPTPAAPEGCYGAHWWLNAGAPEAPAARMWPTLPRDTYAARGHSGQYVVVVPSAELVVVRLGLATLDDDALHGIEPLVRAALEATAGR